MHRSGALSITVLMGLVPAAAGARKGHSLSASSARDAASFVASLPAAILKKLNAPREQQEIPPEGMNACPFCTGFVRRELAICPHCGHTVPAQTSAATNSQGELEWLA